MVKVAKFGGSSVAGVEQFQKVKAMHELAARLRGEGASLFFAALEG